MLNEDKVHDVSCERRNKLDNEQVLCNEAIESDAYDQLSDKAWVMLCEEVAAKERKTTTRPISEVLPE